jgi:hypothetical protein
LDLEVASIPVADSRSARWWAVDRPRGRAIHYERPNTRIEYEHHASLCLQSGRALLLSRARAQFSATIIEERSQTEVSSGHSLSRLVRRDRCLSSAPTPEVYKCKFDFN